MWQGLGIAILMAGLMGQPAFAQIDPPPGGPGDGCTNCPPPVFNTNRNAIKFKYQVFSAIDTNAVASADTNLYNALLAFQTDTNALPVLQIAPYGTNAILVKASHFDYSGETLRDFALLVCDRAETPTWKSIDLSGSSDSQDGWLVQGIVANWQVTDPMYMLVTNTAHDCNSFYHAIPYGGAVVTLAGAQPDDTVSNTLTLQASILDLTGATNQQIKLDVNGVPARYTLSSSNTLAVDTRYNPNGFNQVNATVVCDYARVYDTNNLPDNAKLSFSATAALPLDFENRVYLAFASDMCDSEIGTNYIVFSVDQPQNYTATITDPSTGQVVANYAGFAAAGNVPIAWNLTQADGVTPYSNDTYTVSFTAQFAASAINPTNKIGRVGIRPPGGCLLSYQWEDPSDPSGVGSYLNNIADSAIYQDMVFFFQYIYSQISFTQYGAGDIGPNRNQCQCFPYNRSFLTWAMLVGNLTNMTYSELTIAQSHGSTIDVGGGPYLTNTFEPQDLAGWVNGTGQVSTHPDWRLRRAALWSCYSGSLAARNKTGFYLDFPNACGIFDKAIQDNGYMYKNCGLFFLGLLPQGHYGSAMGVDEVTCQVAEELDMRWVTGPNAYSGGCEPTYSYRWAVQKTINRYPEMLSALPSIAGYAQCVYTSNLDDELKYLDTFDVNQP
ncbi:MAG: hypothetical protein JWQ04_1207 [Pedosphaera sp.]|nr:hypothetical protein [Pedosphaera sp.]